MTTTGLDTQPGERARRITEELRRSLGRIHLGPRFSMVGRVTRAGDGVARAAGLESAVVQELVTVDGVAARVESLRESDCALVLLSSDEQVNAGAVVRRTGQVLSVPSGPSLVGRVIDSLGRPIDGRGPLGVHHWVSVDRLPVPLRDREPVSRPLRTGVFVVDTMVPVGRGQRQLVVGDRATGKTSLCLDVLAGLDADVIGIYVAIGRRGAETATHLSWLERRGFFEHGLAVVADADEPMGLIHLAPYAATAIAEDMMLAGHDVVIVYDDMTTHANAHRSLALLLDRPVAREAFPADVFYAHARLLEKASQLSASRGGGSLTALPIVETQGSDLTGYIPTNLVSIADGQIQLDAGLAAAGQLPAVDIGLSVSRVGGKAQPPMLRAVAGTLKNRYAQFLELEMFSRFGTRLDPSARSMVKWGQTVRSALRQERSRSLAWEEIIGRAALLARQDTARGPVGVQEALDDALAAVAIANPRAWLRMQQGLGVETEHGEKMWEHGARVFMEHGGS